MSYPLSSDVSAAQPTAVEHYNNLRADALYLGNANPDSQSLAGFLNRHIEHVTLEILATNRVRVPHSIGEPPTIMINGYMLQASANVDLPSGQFTGVAATWYIFAVRSASSKTFTLAVNTSPAEATDQRLIGEAVWDGSNLTSVTCYFAPVAQLAEAGYDSGWFAVTISTTYTKAHGLGQTPRLVILLWSASSTGATANFRVLVVVHNSGVISNLYADSANIVATTGNNATAGTLNALPTQSASGYYRILAWR